MHDPTLRQRLEAWWYRRGPSPAWLLLPVSALFVALRGARRLGYRAGLWRSTRLPVPVIVVGNFVAGGAGKTPVVIELARWLKTHGFAPGVVSRGHGRGAGGGVRQVDPHTDDAAAVGDEPLLIARRAAVPVAVGRRRADAGRLLVERCGCDVLIADDGLQHLALARDIEIALVDARGFGNGLPLPAGPLRERPRRVDLRLLPAAAELLSVEPCAGDVVLLRALGDAVPADDWLRGDGGRAQPLQDFAARHARIAAVAGIGHPQQFFDALEAAGVPLVARRALADHHDFRRGAAEFADLDADAILVTEKDAVKCAGLDPRLWVVPLSCRLPQPALDELARRLQQLRPARGERSS